MQAVATQPTDNVTQVPRLEKMMDAKLQMSPDTTDLKFLTNTHGFKIDSTRIDEKDGWRFEIEW